MLPLTYINTVQIYSTVLLSYHSVYYSIYPSLSDYLKMLQALVIPSENANDSAVMDGHVYLALFGVSSPFNPHVYN